MLQALIKKGQVFAANVPKPLCGEGCLLIRVVNSCISSGTEASALSKSAGTVMAKLRKQPHRLQKVVEKIRSEGLLKAYNRVKKGTESANPFGYSVAGVVTAIGKGVTGYQIGDRVAAAGGGYANHAEVVSVPVNLTVPLPETVSFEDGSSVALGAIALQGVRRAGIELGEHCVVYGAGIIGMLTIQLLRLAGIRVASIDTDDRRVEKARALGAELSVNPSVEDAVNAVMEWSGGHGGDAVIFSASTASSEPLSAAFRLTRKKGRVVLVGVSGMNLRREDMYAKELDFVISTSYGPGRYDPSYEQEGGDYPYPYVRWTENRNMSEYIRLLGTGRLDLEPLKEGVFALEDVAAAFARLNATPKPLMLFLDYGVPLAKEAALPLRDDYMLRFSAGTGGRTGAIKTAVVGVGGFAKATILPLLRELSNQYQIHALAGRTGSKLKEIAAEFGVRYAATDVDAVLRDADVELVVVATRHDSHAELTLRALEAGKNVFVEKPLALNSEELNGIVSFYREQTRSEKPMLMVGYNRRFSLYAKSIKQYLSARTGPIYVVYRMNAGYLPPEHWVHRKEGGGRIVGEACHIIDLFTFLTGSTIKSISFESLAAASNPGISSDNKAVLFKYNDGSVCALNYVSVGAKELAKEYMEVHFDGKTLIVDDYRRLDAYGLKIAKTETKTPEKGHREEWLALFEALRGPSGTWPIELWELIQTSEATFVVR